MFPTRSAVMVAILAALVVGAAATSDSQSASATFPTRSANPASCIEGCSGCTAAPPSKSNGGGDLTFTSEPSISSGVCEGEQAPCNMVGCDVTGTLKIQNNTSGGLLWRINGEGPWIVWAEGDPPLEFRWTSSQALECGSVWQLDFAGTSGYYHLFCGPCGETH